MPSPHLRLAMPDDAAQIAAIYAPLVRDSAITFEVDAPTPGQMRDRIVSTSLRLPYLVADDGGDVAAFAYATRHRQRAAYAWSADVSVYVADDRRRAGLGRALYDTLLRLLTAQGYANAFAGIALPNAASVGLHRASGFYLVGVYQSVGYKLGEWWDVAWWQRPLPVGVHPPPPTALAEIDVERVDDALAAGSRLLAA